MSKEANFDGLVGPTHHYAGLSAGNVASMSNRGAVSNPRAAALEGLQKMRELAALGIPQAVLPPHERPHLPTLRRLGFLGSPAQMLDRVPLPILSACSSASAMWVANAATVTPSSDASDARVHLTPANLASKFHRAIEPPHTAQVLRRIFFGPAFVHHPWLPHSGAFADEGAANVMRVASDDESSGVQIYVYGRTAFSAGPEPVRFVARQTREAFEAIARSHGVRRAVFLQQAPEVIDAGVFHNDVIAVSHGSLVFAHEDAFVGGQDALTALEAQVPGLQVVIVPRARVSVEDAVTSYLFNSQIVGPRHDRTLVAAADVAENLATAALVDELRDEGVFSRVHFAPLRQSMRNGGGPACLRLRVVLSDAERAQTHPGVWLDDALYARLTEWVVAHYRDRLVIEDLSDPTLLDEVYRALDALTGILGLPNLYEFQQEPS